MGDEGPLHAAKAAFPTAIAQAAGLLWDFHRLTHPAALVQAPGHGNGNGNGGPQAVQQSSGSASSAADVGNSNVQNLTPRPGEVAPTPSQENLTSMLADLEKRAGPDKQIIAINSLIRLGKPALIPLINQLGHKESSTIRRTARALEGILKDPTNRTPQVRDLLIRESLETGYKTPAEALGLLVIFDDPPAISAIKEAALNHPEPAVRSVAMDTLAISKHSQANRPFFKSMLNDKKSNVSCAAALALAGMGDNSGGDVARRYIKTEGDSTARRKAIDALVVLGEQRDVQLLEEEHKKRPSGETFLAVRQLKLKGLASLQARREFLAEALKEKHAQTEAWAANELFKSTDSDPEAEKLLQQASEDPRHPGRETAETYLKLLKEKRKVK